MRGFLAGVLVGALLLFALERWTGNERSAEIAALEAWERASAPVRKRLADTVRVQTAGAVRWRDRWDTLRLADTLTLTDTVYVRELLATADSAIRSCHRALTTCDQLVQAERERGDSADRRADLWRRQARGTFLRPSVEGLLSGTQPRLAAELEAGRQLSAVARVEFDSLPRWWLGVRYRF